MIKYTHYMFILFVRSKYMYKVHKLIFDCRKYKVPITYLKFKINININAG